MARPGELVTFSFEVRDLNGALVAGLIDGSFTKQIYRRSGAANYAAAGEVVTVTDRGLGKYDATYMLASDSAGYQYYLRVTEGAALDSQEAVHVAAWSVDGASDTTSATASFCSITDVEDRVQRGAFSGSTKPSDTTVLRFMSDRSSRIETELALRGFAYTVPAGTHPFAAIPAGDEERRLKILCRAAAAAGAAADAITAWLGSDSFDVPERAKQLLVEHQDMIDAIGEADRRSTAIVTLGTANDPVRNTVEW